MSENELRSFYKMRVKKPDNYTYDDNGDLVQKNNEGSIIKTYSLPTYRTPTFEEIDEMEKIRMDNIAKAEQEYENAREELRQATDNPNITMSEILSLNRKISDLDNILQSVRFPLRQVADIGTFQVREILLDDIYETRKLPNSIKSLITRPFELQQQYVRIGEAPIKQIQTVEEIRQKTSALVPVILFSEPSTNEYDFMGLKWAVNVEYNNTQYNSVYQALMAELAKVFNDNDNLQKIMIADSAEDIDYSVDMVPGDREINEPKWNTAISQLLYPINIEKYKQYPELSEKILQTKQAKLGYYIPDDNLLGIGISIDNPNAKDINKWTGQNMVGNTLEKVRTEISKNRIAIQQSQQGIQSITEQTSTKTKRIRKPVVISA